MVPPSPPTHGIGRAFRRTHPQRYPCPSPPFIDRILELRHHASCSRVPAQSSA
ncbi:hypothetical protein GQ43DRAFT_437370 [Delitschia confertaspora ATCC 74209]|uniref:Uncharacterized protein n=1 Tax=Delitschia confertaspora ATCC 74209 TaxID=1513339 RepID=A0A9P4JTI5_9PLEO|nr:hypothetical protein GQ43DRAFT_437370 [Delitschia confertaspora ATCC 74209]